MVSAWVQLGVWKKGVPNLCYRRCIGNRQARLGKDWPLSGKTMAWDMTTFRDPLLARQCSFQSSQMAALGL